MRKTLSTGKCHLGLNAQNEAARKISTLKVLAYEENFRDTNNHFIKTLYVTLDNGAFRSLSCLCHVSVNDISTSTVRVVI